MIGHLGNEVIKVLLSGSVTGAAPSSQTPNLGNLIEI